MPETAINKNIDAKIRASFFILLQTCADMALNDAGAPDAFGGDRSAVIDCALNLAGGGPFGAMFDALRARLLKALKDAGTVKVFQVLVKRWLWQEYNLNKLKDAEPPDDGGEVFLEHIDSLVKLVGDGGEHVVETSRLSGYMSFIPMRMTAARYGDYIKDAVNIMEYIPRTEDADGYARLFCPMRYCDDCGDLSDILKELWAAEPSGYDKETYGAAMERADGVEKQLINDVTGLNTLFDAVNALKISADYNAAALIADDAEARGLYGRFKALLAPGTDENAEDFGNRVNEAIEAALDAIDDDCLSNLTDEDIINGSGRVITREQLETLNKLFYETGMDYYGLGAGLYDGASAGADAFLNEFLPIIIACTSEMNGKRKRFLRQHFLQYLPYPYDVKEYRQYFLDAYESADNAHRSLLTVFVASMDRRRETNADNDL